MDGASEMVSELLSSSILPELLQPGTISLKDQNICKDWLALDGHNNG